MGRAGLTVSVAGCVAVDLALFANTARYRLPDIETFVDESVSVVDVASRTLENLRPPLVETCHLTDLAEHLGGVDAAALNQAGAGALAVAFAGWVVTLGATQRRGLVEADTRLARLRLSTLCR